MPVSEGRYFRNLSKEWAAARAKYRAYGLGESRVVDCAHRYMRRKYGVG